MIEELHDGVPFLFPRRAPYRDTIELIEIYININNKEQDTSELDIYNQVFNNSKQSNLKDSKDVNRKKTIEMLEAQLDTAIEELADQIKEQQEKDLQEANKEQKNFLKDEINNMEKRINRLEKKMKTLNRNTYKFINI